MLRERAFCATHHDGSWPGTQRRDRPYQHARACLLDSTRKTWWTPTLRATRTPHQPLTVENSAIARWNALAIRDNLFVGPEDFDQQVGELSRFVTAGGSCIVDLTCEGIGPYPDLLMEASEAIGLHIVAGAGFMYTPRIRPGWRPRVSEIAAAIYNQVTAGIGDTAVLPGIIGKSEPLLTSPSARERS